MNILKLGIGPFLGGILFSLGLGVSGMTEPSKVISFLDIFGDWDPSLAFVMVGAIGVNAILYRFITKRPASLFGGEFQVPSKTTLDKSLLVGAAIFGLGWGVTGLCPGPALASISTGKMYSLFFVAAMIVGVVLAKILQSRISQTTARL